MSEQEINLTELISKRGVLKRHITMLQKLAHSDKADKIRQLETRLTKCDEWWNEFQYIQGQIEYVDSSEEQYEQRDSFQESYFEVVAFAKHLVKETQAPVINLQNSQPQGVRVDSSEVRLAPIEIPKFDGSYNKWLGFWDAFNTMIESNQKLSAYQKFAYLQKSLTGQAASVIEDMTITESNYKDALDLLKSTYENKKVITYSHLEALDDLEIRKGTYENLNKFLNDIRKNLRCLKNLGHDLSGWETYLVFHLQKKLDIDSKKEWKRGLGVDEFPKLDQFLNFLIHRCKLLEPENVNTNFQKVQIGQNYKSGQNKYFNKSSGCAKTFLGVESNVGNQCSLCKSNEHYRLQDCQKFISLPLEARRNEVSKINMCWNCLSQGHKVYKCLARGCKHCGRKHHSLLHSNQGFRMANDVKVENSIPLSAPRSTQEDTKATREEGVSLMSHCTQKGEVLLSTALVEIEDVGGNYHICRALLDSISMSSFITKDLKEKLRLTIRDIKMSIKGIGSGTTKVNSYVTSCFKSRCSGAKFKTDFLIIDKISERVPCLPVDITQISIPEDFTLADQDFANPGKIDLLIGSAVFWELLGNKQHKLGPGKPILQQTSLGWVVVGEVNALNSRVADKVNECFLVSKLGVQDQLEKFWKIEEVTQGKLLSKEGEKCEENHQERPERKIYRHFTFQGEWIDVGEFRKISMDWSDHALWWPEQNIWLTRTRSTLDQCGVHADALLHFTPMHKNLRVQLPDLRYLDMRVDFSIKTFSAVTQVCKDLGIRHPEELSFCKPLESNHLKYNYKDLPKKKIEQNGTVKNGQLPADTNTFIANSSPGGSTGSLDKAPFMCAPVTPARGPSTSTPVNSPSGNSGTWKKNGFGNDLNGTLNYSGNVTTSLSYEQLNGSIDSSLAQSPPPLSPEARRHLIRPKSLLEKARMNVAWLDSSLSIMEQGVREHGTLCLKFKFYAFYDLNPKYDAIRINQIYEQAKWQLLNEEIDCTEEEMLMFAALQLQVQIQANQPQPIPDNGAIPSPVEDDIDAALNNLQTTLEGSSISTLSNDITQVPELKDQLRFFKPKKFTLKAYKKYWFTCRDLHLYVFKTKEEMMNYHNPVYNINLKGCEVTPDVNIMQNKYVIKLEVPSPDGMSEMYIRCDDETQYARWMACCRLAAKGRSLADSSYESEKQTILDFLNLQRPAEQPVLNPNSLDIQVEDYIAPKYLKKSKGKLMQRILEAHANVKDLGLIDAKMNYIKAWQLLPDYGITLFVVKFMNSKKEELLGVSYNRMMKMDINSGDHQKTWRFNTMKAWNVNWENKHMMVQFEEGNIMFSCLSADCKVIHEFIGGYIFLSTRSKDASQTLNEELFHKLTGGWS